MIDLKVVSREIYINRKKVRAAADRGTDKAMVKGLAFVRRRAMRNELRRRKRPSKPGQAPSVHSRDPYATLKKILFDYDRQTKSGIVGPVKLNQREQDWITMGSTTVPQILEFGGVVSIQEVQSAWGTKWFRRDKRRSPRPGEKRRTRRAVYKPRPFMSKALEHETQKGNIASPWANVVS